MDRRDPRPTAPCSGRRQPAGLPSPTASSDLSGPAADSDRDRPRPP